MNAPLVLSSNESNSYVITRRRLRGVQKTHARFFSSNHVHIMTCVVKALLHDE
jgi:hypothetical protein